MDVDSRIKYYLGNLSSYYGCEYVTTINYEVDNNHEIISFNKIQYIDNQKLFYGDYHKQIHNYMVDLRKYLKFSNIDEFKLLIAFGDIFQKFDKFTLTKSRPVDSSDNFNVLLNLNTPRHWATLNSVLINDIPFYEKKNKIVWRGCNTGPSNHFENQRYILIDTYQNNTNTNIDVSFSSLPQSSTSKNTYKLDKMNIKKQLMHKFILSVQGNDVATNLKWIMYSNSLVFMSKPTICSWFMEDTLIPGYHYVELKPDFSDLEEKFNWCCEHLTECEQIIKNANQYVKQFLDENVELEITKKILDLYTGVIKIKLK